MYMKGVIDATFSQNLQILKQPSSKYLSKLKAVNLSYCAHHSTSPEHDLQHNKYPRFLGSALFSFLAINPLKVCFLFCFVLFCFKYMYALRQLAPLNFLRTEE